MQNLWDSHLGSDITIIFENGERIRAHKAFLALKSTVLFDLFTEFPDVNELNMKHEETLMSLYEFPFTYEGGLQIGDRELEFETFADILLELEKYDGIKDIKGHIESFFKEVEAKSLSGTKVPVSWWVKFGYKPEHHWLDAFGANNVFDHRVEGFFDLEAFCILSDEYEVNKFIEDATLDDDDVQRFIEIY